MTSRSQLLKPHEARAIVEGRKTQMRTVIAKPRWAVDREYKIMSSEQNDPFPDQLCTAARDGNYYPIKLPWKIGDRFWGKETHAWDHVNRKWIYRADGEVGKYNRLAWFPSTAMKQYRSRILCEITNVRVERLQDITPEDCLAEGWTGYSTSIRNPFSQFSLQWDLDHKKEDQWAASPWVLVREFTGVVG